MKDLVSIKNKHDCGGGDKTDSITLHNRISNTQVLAHFHTINRQTDKQQYLPQINTGL